MGRDEPEDVHGIEDRRRVTVQYRHFRRYGLRQNHHAERPFENDRTGRARADKRGRSRIAASAAELEIGRAHVRTPVTNAHLECRLLRAKKTKKTIIISYVYKSV